MRRQDFWIETGDMCRSKRSWHVHLYIQKIILGKYHNLYRPSHNLHHSSIESALREVHPLQVAPGEVGAGEVAAAHVGVLEVDVPQVQPGQIGSGLKMCQLSIIN